MNVSETKLKQMEDQVCLLETCAATLQLKKKKAFNKHFNLVNVPSELDRWE